MERAPRSRLMALLIVAFPTPSSIATSSRCAPPRTIRLIASRRAGESNLATSASAANWSVVRDSENSVVMSRAWMFVAGAILVEPTGAPTVQSFHRLDRMACDLEKASPSLSVVNFLHAQRTCLPGYELKVVAGTLTVVPAGG